MDVGDKVKLIKGNPFGKVGVIKQVVHMTGPFNVTTDPLALKEGQNTKYFAIEADDGTVFSGAEDDLELLES